MSDEVLQSSHKAIIALGSNLGDRSRYLSEAISLICERAGNVVRASSVIETKAWGFDSYPFLNQVIVIETRHTPMQLLDILQEIERELGRTTKSEVQDGKIVYHARTIDLDILDFDGLHISNERLTLPHPHINERDFVLIPLKELGITIL